MHTAHEALITKQFGVRAQAYVESADHRTGADLDRLVEIARTRPDARVLDLGCGGGHVSFAVAPLVREVVAYDLSSEMLEAVAATAAARGLTRIRTVQGSAEDLPFEDTAFDLVLTRFSAHHWYDLAAGLRSMRRVLAPAGLAVVMDTVAPPTALLDTFLQSIEMLRDPSHVRNYTVGEWEAKLRAAGFAPATARLARLRLDFAKWTARMGTPDNELSSIRTLQAAMPPAVAEHFAIEPDGSFTIDTVMIEAVSIGAAPMRGAG